MDHSGSELGSGKCPLKNAVACQDGPMAVLRESKGSQEKTLKKVATSGYIPTSPTCAVSQSDVRSAARSGFGEKHIITALDATRRTGLS